MTMKRIVLTFFLAACALAAHADELPAIADNSFLVEEAYNQDPGVVQHISTFERLTGSNEWAYSFTQEWPAPNLRHQLSYTLLLQESGGHRGIGDVALHYRYQIGSSETRVAVAPRVSLLLPTGDEKRGFGEGAAGVQFMLPVSTKLAPSLVAHWNAGATFIPANDTRAWTAANSFVWLVHPRFNALVETVWTRSETIHDHENEVIVSPGIRWSYNFAGGLQIVPGIALPVPVGPHHGDRSVFLYLSFEHPFRRAS
jgi:hypothetical protein